MYLPKADSGRIIIGTWWLVVIVLVTTYCGNLVAFLTFPKMEVPITNINQLIKLDGKLTWGIKAGTYLEDYLKESDEPKHQKLLKYTALHDELSEEIVERIRRGQHVYIDWKTNLLYIMKNQYEKTDHCDFALGKQLKCSTSLLSSLQLLLFFKLLKSFWRSKFL
jgi:glutamate receptor, ionotropic, invertebrate